MRWMDRYKPAASARTHALLAATLWTLVGTGLLTAGTAWARAGGTTWLAGTTAVAVVVGLAKARFALGKTARRISERICRRGEGRCLGGFLSWQMWLIVLGMMLLGRLLRLGVLPQLLVAFIYQAVGVALLTGAVFLWRAYLSLARPA